MSEMQKTKAQQAQEKGLTVLRESVLPGASNRNSYPYQARSSVNTDVADKVLSERHLFRNTSHRIDTAVENANSYKNPIQGTMEALDYAMAHGSNSNLYTIDTEWIGGGKGLDGKGGMIDLPTIVTEFGISGFSKTGGVGEGYTFAMAARSKDDVRVFRDIYERCRKQWEMGNNFVELTDAEWRSMKDLISYSAKMEMSANGVINKRVDVSSLRQGDSLRKFSRQIEEGLQFLENGGRSGVKARTVNNVHEVIAQTVMKGRADLSVNPIFFGHNWQNADRKAWEEYAPGMSMTQLVSGKTGGYDHIVDTYSLIRAGTGSPAKTLAGDGVYEKTTSMENISRVLGLGKYEHMAGKDAQAHAHAVLDILSGNGKILGKSPILNKSGINYKSGSKLFATGSVSRDADSPLDFVENLETGKVDGFQRTSIFRDQIYELEREIEYQYGDKKYFGVVLKRDNDSRHYIFRDNVDALRNVIQSNFTSMDTMTQAEIDLTKHYDLTEKAASYYNRMFAGDKAQQYFKKNLKAMDILNRNGWDMKKATPELRKAGFTKPGIRDLGTLAPRLQSEYGFLSQVGQALEGLKNPAQKSYALAQVFANMTSVSPHRTNIPLPKFHSQSQLRIDGLGEWRLQTSSHAKLAESLNRVLKDDRGNKKYNFQDMRNRALTVIDQLQRNAESLSVHGGLKREEYKALEARIKNHAAPSDSSMAGSGLIAQDIADTFRKQIVSEAAVEKEAVSARNAASVSALGQIDLKQIQNAASYQGGYNTKDGWHYGMSPELTTKLREVDDYLDRYAASFVGKAPIVPRDTVMEQVQKMLRAASGEGIHLEISLNEQKTGLAIAMRDMQRSSAVARGLVPLVEVAGEWEGTYLDTGTVNIARPIVKDGKVVMTSYQEKLLQKMGYSSFFQKIKKHLSTGDVAAAESYAAWTVRNTLSELPGASMYRHSDEMSNVTSRSYHQNYFARRKSDINDLAYTYFREKGKLPDNFYPEDLQGLLNKVYSRNRITSSQFMDMAFLSSDTAVDAGIGKMSSEIAQDIRNIRKMTQAAGLKFGAGNKGEQVQSGILTDARTGEARNAVTLGFMGYDKNGHVVNTDLGRENYLQRMNYNPFSQNDWVLMEGRAAPVRRSEMERMMKHRGVGYMNRNYVQQKGFSEIGARVGGVQDSQNLITAYLDPSELKDWIDPNEKTRRLRSGQMTPFEMPNTGIDQAMLDASVAPFMQVNDTIALEMPDYIDKSLFPSLKVGDYVNAKTIGQMEEYLGMNLYKYGSSDWVFEGWEEATELRGRRMKMSRINQVSDGSKFITTGGNKVSDRLIENLPALFGNGFENVRKVANLSPTKMPGDILEGQFRMLAHAATEAGLGASEAGKVQAQAQAVWNAGTIGKQHGLRPTTEFRDGVWTITLPDVNDQVIAADKPRFTMNMMEVVKKTNEILTTDSAYRKLGLKTMVERNGHTAILGMTAYTQPNMVHWESVSDSHLVRMNARNLQMLQGRASIYGNYPGISATDIPNFDVIYNSMINASYREEDGLFQKEARQMMDVLRAASGKEVQAPIHTGAYSILGGTNAMHTAEEVRGSILDPKLYNGQAHYLSLPEQLEVGGLKMDKVLIPSFHLTSDKNASLDSVRSSAYKLQQWTEDYRKSFIFKGTDNLAEGILPGQRQELLEEGRKLLGNYLTETGNAFQSKDGYIWKNLTNVEVRHSGRAKYQIAQRIKDPELDKFLTEMLPEGDALISRRDFMGMLGPAGKDLSKEQIAEFMGQAEKGEFYGLTLREPVTNHTSMRATKFRILSEQSEADLFKRLGGDKISGQILHTVGTSVAQKADTDGDMAFFLAPQLAEYVARKGETSKDAAARAEATTRELKKMFHQEKAFFDSLEEMKTSELERVNRIWDNSSATLVHAMEAGEGGDRVAARLMGEAVEIQSRLTKQVGLFSNIAYRANRITETAAMNMGETVGSYTKSIVGSLFAAVEQVPTSYKKFGEIFDRAFANTGKISKEDVTDAVDNYVTSMAKFRSSFNNWDVEGMAGSLQQLGIFDAKGNFVGGAKGAIENALMGGLTLDDTRRILYNIKSSHPDLAMNESKVIRGPEVNIGKSPFTGDVDDTVKSSVGLINAYDNPEAGSSNMLLLRDRIGDNKEDYFQAVRKYHEQMGSTMAATQNAQGISGSITAADVLPGGDNAPLDTIGSHLTQKIANAIGVGEGLGKMASGALGITAGAVGIGMVASRFIRPSVERETEAGRDGSAMGEAAALPPAAYAGAPEGSAPAYISENGKGYAKTTVRISGRTMGGVDQNSLAAELSREISRQSGLQMNIQISNTDDRESIDSNWLNQQFANALKTGYVT